MRSLEFSDCDQLHSEAFTVPHIIMLLVQPGVSPFVPLRKKIRMSAGRTKAAKAATRVDVAVVGGGPGGLATAAAVRSAFGKHVGVKVRQHGSQTGWYRT